VQSEESCSTSGQFALSIQVVCKCLFDNFKSQESPTVQLSETYSHLAKGFLTHLLFGVIFIQLTMFASFILLDELNILDYIVDIAIEVYATCNRACS
jgi:hypothetical protein